MTVEDVCELDKKYRTYEERHNRLNLRAAQLRLLGR